MLRPFVRAFRGSTSIHRRFSTAGGAAPSKEKLVEQKNLEVVQIINKADCHFVDVAPARDVVPGMKDKMLLHSGSPIEYERMCSVQKGAMIGGVLFEKWAQTPEEADKMLRSGKVAVACGADHDAAGPIGGMISPSLPVFVVENRAFGNRAYSRPAEMWEMWGNYDKLPNLLHWRDVAAPSMSRALKLFKGGLPLTALIAESMEMGDESGMRGTALTQLVSNAFIREMLTANLPREDIMHTMGLLSFPSIGGGGPRALIGLTIAAALASLQPAANIPYSSVVTSMRRNGVEWSIRVAGTGNQWHTAPSVVATVWNYGQNAATKQNYKPEDRGLDIGDSALLETMGWGGLSLSAAATSYLKLIGGTSVEQAFGLTDEMRNIVVGESSHYKIPALGPVTQRGCPLGIDVVKVVNSGISPIISTGITHKDVGHGPIARGRLRAPMECFQKAYNALVTKNGNIY